MDTVFGFFRARTIQVFAELQVADDIAAGRPPAVNERFLNACAAIGLLHPAANASFELTPLGQALRSDLPGSLQPFAASVMGGGHYQAWGRLAESARTGACAFAETYGERIWDYFTKTNPAEGHLFNKAMAASSAYVVQSVLDHYTFPQSGLIIDVAGGNGAMLSAILKTVPDARGIVTDLPFTEPAALANIAAQELSHRCQFHAGDFFQAVPAGGDLYTMKWILHDWSDPKAAAILQTIHKAMPAHAKLLLIEAIVPETGDDTFGRLMDLNMMVMCGGKERTRTEWAALLNANGFALSRTIHIPGPVSLIEATRQ
jgi:hypothetical protein